MARLLEVAIFASLAVAALTKESIRVCYYSNWSQYRPSRGKFFPKDIDPFLCTHVVYSFAKLDYKHELAFYEWNDDKLYRKCNDKNDPASLKSLNPNLKTLLATGGWNAGSKIYSDMVFDVTLRKKFARTSVDFLRKWGFDGLDLDWEYPALRGGRPEDKFNFIELIKDCLEEFNKDPVQPRLLLTAAVAAGKSNVDTAYNIPEMAKYLDFINLMSYDLHGGWNSYTGFNSPLYARSSETGDERKLNVDWAANYWVQKGTPKNKLIIGLATYGRHFQLANPNNHNPGDAAVGSGGTAGTYTREKGFLAYYEICEMLSNGATRYWEPEQMVPYVVSGDQWIGYDDEESIRKKLLYIKDKQYGGAMVWNIDLDDFNGQCPLSKRRYPLMSLMKEALGGYTPPATTQGPTTNTEKTATTQQATTKEATVTTDEHETTMIMTGATNTTGEFSCVGRTNGFYSDPSDCAAYFHCWDERKYRTVCGNGLLWNQDRKYCDYPEEVECQVVTSKTTDATATARTTTDATTRAKTVATTIRSTETPTDSPTTNQPGDFCKNMADGLYKKKDDCQSYYTCSHGKTHVNICPSGTLFDAAGKICDWKENVDCNEDEDTSDFCANKVDGIYTYPDDCRKFYHCGSSNTFVKTCAQGLYYNTNSKNCDWPVNVDCGSRPVPAELKNLGNKCIGLDDGLYPDHRSCHNFIQCKNGENILKSCGNFLRFNPEISNCDWPMNVLCLTSLKLGHK